MRTFSFKLKALLKLKETKRDQALSQFAFSINEVDRLEEGFLDAQKKYQSVLKLLHDSQRGNFKSSQIEALQSSLLLEKENLAQTELNLKQAKEIASARRKIFLEKDSELKAISLLKEKQKQAHYFSENKKEQAELEDITGARFLFKRINSQV